VTGNGAFDRAGQVVPEVPPVGDLDGQWRAFGGTSGVAAAAVPADDLDPWVGVQPGAERARGPFGQHVHGPAVWMSIITVP
jgi:hypothetical protein